MLRPTDLQFVHLSLTAGGRWGLPSGQVKAQEVRKAVGSKTGQRSSSCALQGSPARWWWTRPQVYGHGHGGAPLVAASARPQVAVPGGWSI